MPYADPEAQREYQRRWMQERRATALAGKTCSFCGGSDQLEFHHFDQGDKVDHKVWSWTAERRKAELAKCVIICRACHIRRHKEDRPAFCKRGHPLQGSNVYVKPSTRRRECRTCRAARRSR